MDLNFKSVPILFIVYGTIWQTEIFLFEGQPSELRISPDYIRSALLAIPLRWKAPEASNWPHIFKISIIHPICSLLSFSYIKLFDIKVHEQKGNPKMEK